MTSLSLVPGGDFLKIGQTAALSIEATYSDGSRGPMTATSWGCDNPAVASVSGGTVTGLGAGEATVYGECQHGRATRRLRITPDYAGTWSGGYYWRSCSESGQFAAERVCAEMPIGVEAPILLRLGQDRDRVTGTVALGELAGDVSGVIAVPGNLDVTGSMRYELDGVVLNVQFAEWSTMAAGDRMTGRFKLVWTVAGASGNMTIECEISGVGRTNQVTAAAGARLHPTAKLRLPALIRWLAGVAW